jgi:polysaccharide export outer membrane protein
VDIPTLFTGSNPQNNVVLQGGDTIYVNLAPVFYIYGEAQRPGSYRINRGMTVMQALAQGGGPTPRGSSTRLQLTRKSADGSAVETQPKLTDLVMPDDVIYVKESLF